MKKRFQKVNVEISNICNLQCSFCPEVLREKGMMNKELFQRILTQVSPLTEQVCFHLMGDPLVHPLINEFMEMAGLAGARVFLVTNGINLKEKQSQALLQSAVRQVNFSIHSFPDNFPEKDPTDYLEKIFRFTEQAFERRPDLYVNFRLWNLQEEKGTGARNREILAKVQERFGTTNLEEVSVKTRKSVLLKNRLYLHFDSEFIWPSLDLPELGTRGTCYGLSNHFGILVDGTVVPCCLDKEGKIPLGKIQDEEILTILDSPRAQTILKGFQQRILKEDLCKRCQYIQRFPA